MSLEFGAAARAESARRQDMTYLSRCTDDKSAPRQLHNGTGEAAALVTGYVEEYPVRDTRRNKRYQLARLFRLTGTSHPSELTTDLIVTWCAGSRDPLARGGAKLTDKNPVANNTVRARLALVSTFFDYCRRQGITVADLTQIRKQLYRSFPTTYGKAQSANPPRFLSYDEAFGSLLAACSDGTWLGSRDQLAIRLGLMGARRAEIAAMRWHHYEDGTFTYTGKGNKPRSSTAGPEMRELLARWKRAQEKGLGRPVRPSDPILCIAQPGGQPGWKRGMKWGTRITERGVYELVVKRAKVAALGHVAPHDLRRTVGNILYNDFTPDGGRRFDLGDIQEVLDHSSPVTTKRSYIAPIERAAAKRKAAAVLD